MDKTFKAAYGAKSYTPKQPGRMTGASKGLAEKMDYWFDKDYQFEYGVTMGMAMNISYAQEAANPGYDMKELIKKVFKTALEMKLDPEMIALFDEYYSKKKHINRPGSQISVTPELL